ncbi:hypothetical protein D3C71_1124560 [compost metagenome]
MVQCRRLRGEVGHDAFHGGLGIADLEVDFTAAGEARDAVFDQLGQRVAAGGNQRGDQQPRNHARVGIGEFAEVMVRAHLAAIYGVLGTHLFLDESVAALAQHRHAAGGFHHFHGVPGQARIVDDFPARIARQDGLGQQADQVIAFDETAVVVEEEAAVEIAIPGNTEIRAMLTHRVGGCGAVFRQQRVGNAIREVAIRLVADAHELERQVRRQQINDGTCATIAGIDHQLQRLQCGHIHIAQQMLDIGALVVLGNLAGAGWQRCAVIGGNRVGNGEQASIRTDRLGLLTHQLHAVVVHRVVAGGDHHPAGRL